MERHVQVAEVLAAATESLRGSMYISMPGSIVSYTPATQMAVVQPRLADVRFDVDTGAVIYEPWPQINCRVMWPAFGGMVLVGPMLPGDSVSLIAWDLDPSGITSPGNTVVQPSNVAKLSGHTWRAIPEALLTLMASDAAASAVFLILGVQGGAQLQIAKDGSSIAIVKTPVVSVGDASTTKVGLGPATSPLALGPPVTAGFGATGTYAAALTAAAQAIVSAPPVTLPQIAASLVALASAMVAAGGPMASAMTTAENNTPTLVVKGA